MFGCFAAFGVGVVQSWTVTLVQSMVPPLPCAALSGVEDCVAYERRKYLGVDPSFGSARSVSWVVAVVEVFLCALHCVVDLLPFFSLPTPAMSMSRR